MSYLKDYSCFRKLKNILVYADNSAVDFFKKQEFTECTWPKKKYEFQIDHFEYSTLMVCKLNSSAMVNIFKQIKEKEERN